MTENLPVTQLGPQFHFSLFILRSCYNPMQQASISKILEQFCATDLSLFVESVTPHPVGTVASWLVSSSPDGTVLVRALLGGVALCS